MPQYKPSRWHNEKEVEKLNENRQGSLLILFGILPNDFPNVLMNMKHY